MEALDKYLNGYDFSKIYTDSFLRIQNFQLYSLHSLYNDTISGIQHYKNYEWAILQVEKDIEIQKSMYSFWEKFFPEYKKIIQDRKDLIKKLEDKSDKLFPAYPLEGITENHRLKWRRL